MEKKCAHNRTARTAPLQMSRIEKSPQSSTNRETGLQKTKNQKNMVTVEDIMRGQRAWRGHDPTVEAIAKILKKHPNTTMMAITRRGATTLNNLALQARYGEQEPLVTLKGGIEANPNNWIKNQLKKKRLGILGVKNLHRNASLIHAQHRQSQRLREWHGRSSGRLV